MNNTHVGPVRQLTSLNNVKFGHDQRVGLHLPAKHAVAEFRFMHLHAYLPIHPHRVG